MINNGDVLRWSEPVEQSYQNAVDRLIVNIARHLKSGKAIHTAKWETQKLSEMGQLTAENAKIINDALKQMPQQMRDALDDTAKESLRLVDEAIEEAIQTGAVGRSPISSTQGIIDELSQQALDQFNLVNTTMLQSTQTAYLKAISDTVMWENRMMTADQKGATLETLNDATTAILSGGETRTVALRRAIKELNDHGLYGFVDRAGRHWSPEAYVNMCMRTTVHNVAVRSVRGRQEEYGSSIFQCSYHPASRTEHYPFQNKFYDWNGQSGTFTDGNGQKHKYESVTVTGYGTAAGLFGINCGHFPLPQIPGVTIPTDPEMQSPERDAKEYRESQVQRRLERNIRQSKRLVDAYKAAGDDKGAEEAQDAVRMDQARMREFIARTGRHRRYDREQISGYGPDKLNRPKKPTPKPKPTIEDQKTVREVTEFFKSKDWFIKSTLPDGTPFNSSDYLSLDKCDLESSKAIYRAYELVFRKYPQLVGKLSAPTSDRLAKKVYAQCTFGFGNEAIQVNDMYFSDFEKLKQSFATDVEQNFHPKGLKNPMAIVVHELGHAIDGYLTYGENLGGQGKKGPKSVSDMLRPKVMKACGYTIKDTAETVSIYATKNAKEWLAESFSEAMCSDDPRPVAVELLKQLDELMKGVR